MRMFHYRCAIAANCDIYWLGKHCCKLRSALCFSLEHGCTRRQLVQHRDVNHHSAHIHSDLVWHDFNVTHKQPDESINTDQRADVDHDAAICVNLYARLVADDLWSDLINSVCIDCVCDGSSNEHQHNCCEPVHWGLHPDCRYP